MTVFKDLKKSLLKVKKLKVDFTHRLNGVFCVGQKSFVRIYCYSIFQESFNTPLFTNTGKKKKRKIKLNVLSVFLFKKN